MDDCWDMNAYVSLFQLLSRLKSRSRIRRRGQLVLACSMIAVFGVPGVARRSLIERV
jgi:hypothetical protein